MFHKVVGGVFLLLLAVAHSNGYALSLPEEFPAELPDQSVAGEVIWIAPGLNGLTPGPYDPTPGEEISTIASNRTDSALEVLGTGGGSPGEFGDDVLSERSLSMSVVPEPSVMVLCLAALLLMKRGRRGC